MKTRQVTEYIGEDVGPVDWNYDFFSHFSGFCGSDKESYCAKHVERLRLLCNGEEWEATTYGGWPRCGWGRVLKVCMYDGWPYWRPVPSVLTHGTLGGEWHPFCAITNIRRVSKREDII